MTLKVVAHVFAHRVGPCSDPTPHQFRAWLAEEPEWAALFEACASTGFDAESLADLLAVEHIVYMSGCDGACPWDDDDEQEEVRR